MKTRVLYRSSVLGALKDIGYFKETITIPEGTSWDKTVLDVTRYFSYDGYTCLRPPGEAGAIIYARKSNLMLLGCAEPPLGPTCKDLGECDMQDGHCVRTIHAEVNAIMLALRKGISIKGATIYSLLKPCFNCSKMIVAAGIRRIIYAGAAYDEERTRKLLELAKVECAYIDIGLGYGQQS